MKALVLSQKSWHYWIAYKISDYRWYDHGDENICSYSKAVMKGLLIMAIAALIIAILAFGAWSFIFGVILTIMYGAYMFTAAGEAVLVVLALLAGGGILVSLLYLGVSIIEKFRDNPTRPGTFIAAAYSSLKGKYCIPITFEEWK